MLYLCDCMAHVCTPRGRKGAVRSSAAGVTGSCEPPTMEFRSSGRAVTADQPL